MPCAPSVLPQPPNRVWVSGLGESGIELTIWLFTDFDVGIATTNALYTEIYRRFRAEGIEIPVPKRDVHVLPEPIAPQPSAGSHEPDDSDRSSS